MAGRLVEQLVEAGLITETQARAGDVVDPVAPSARIVESLVGAGVDERALAGFFVSRGFGPMLQTQELARADVNLIRCLPGTDAHELCAMPLRSSPAGAIVAMADPTDEGAVARLTQALGGSILPTVAKLSDLLASIDRVYPADRPTLATDRLASAHSSTPSSVVPLVQEKAEIGADQPSSAFDPGLSELASTASPVWDRAWNRSTTEREVSLTPKSSRIPLPIVSRSMTPLSSARPPGAPLPSVAPSTPTTVVGPPRHGRDLRRFPTPPSTPTSPSWAASRRAMTSCVSHVRRAWPPRAPRRSLPFAKVCSAGGTARVRT